jgi:glycosyltransferase involved in cell wall biosynthesis
VTKDPAVTVIVPFLNAERTIGALLRGLESLRPTELGAAEFVFVDNGSTDAGPALVEAAAIPESRLVVQPTPGVSAARNRGLALARGEIVALIDSDCVPSRQWLRELVAPFQDPAVHLVAGGLASFPPRTAAQRFAARYGLNDAHRTLQMALPFANGRNMAVRRSSAEHVEGWAEDVLRGDDIDFSTRLLDAVGGSIEYRERALAYHQDRETDEDLWKQARGYGLGIALMYERYPDRLPWGRAEKFRQLRTSSRRRLSASFARLGRVMGFVSDADVEFAEYLAHWDRAFWKGFADARRARRAGSTAASLVANT